MSAALLTMLSPALPGRAEPTGTVAPPPALAVQFFAVGAFRLGLRRDTQTLARLSPTAEPGFDFVPGGHEAERAGDGYVHLGDVNLRLRVAGGAWQDFSSAHVRRPIRPLPTGPGEWAAADITASMGADVPLTVERRWVAERGAPVLRVTLANRGAEPVEVGGLGLPMVFDNLITGRTLEQAHAQASFADPYIGRDAGYLQVTRLSGNGPALLVLPERGTPLEAYRPIAEAAHAAPGDILTDLTPRSQTAEGFYDWMVASRGFAERGWRAAGPQWNEPTSFTLAPGERRTVGLRFVLAPSIRAIQATLLAQDRPVATGVPGYVVPTDLPATLFLHAPSPVVATESWPAGALDVSAAGTRGDWRRYTVAGHGFGPARLTIRYADGQAQTVSYYVTAPLDRTMAALGRFATTRQWFAGAGDPFRRTPAILTYDHEAGGIVTQEPRVWIAGMSDEGGAGAWVAAAAKQLDNPDPAEVTKLETLIDRTVLGTLTVAAGPHAGGVRKSIFFYDPKGVPGYYEPKIDWSRWTSWSRKDAGDLGRAYNYPHVAIGYWVLYRLARNHPGLVTHHSWRWYLDYAYQTVAAMMRDAPYYTQFGLMEGDMFVDLLADLRREGLTAEAAAMTAAMKRRADHWTTLAYPFGSEMAWDSTGQPEVYAWMHFFGHPAQAAITREAILGYDPAIPSWGYNGNARRYWDFLYGGKVARIERQIHHYGSTLNAVPLLTAFRADPADTHLLRVGYGGLMGGITNIGPDGFGSAAFHSYPDMMRWDAYTGDYGMGFFGHANNAATYLVNDPTFGWLAYGGLLAEQPGGVQRVELRDGARSRLFVAPAGLWITLEAGKIRQARYDPRDGQVVLTLDPRDAHTPAARLFLAATTPGARRYLPEGGRWERGGYTLPLGRAAREVVLSPL